jgi:hypothetical protein
MHEFNLILKTFQPGNPKSFGACTDENILTSAPVESNLLTNI